MKFLKNTAALASVSFALLAGCSSSDIPDSCSATPLNEADAAQLKNAFLDFAELSDKEDPSVSEFLSHIQKIHATVQEILDRNPKTCDAQLAFAITNELNLFNEEHIAEFLKSIPLDGKPDSNYMKLASQYTVFQDIAMKKVLPGHDISTAYLHNVASNSDYEYAVGLGLVLNQADFQVALAAFYLLRMGIVSYGSLDYGGYDEKDMANAALFSESTDWSNLSQEQKDFLNKMISLLTSPDSKFLSVRKEYVAESRKNRESLDSAITSLDRALASFAINDTYEIGMDKILMARMFIPMLKDVLRGEVLDIGKIAGSFGGPAVAAEVQKEVANALGFTKINFAKIFDLTDGYQKYLPRFEYDKQNPLKLESYYFLDKDGQKTISFDKLDEEHLMELAKYTYLPDPTIGGVFPDAVNPNPLVSLVAAPGMLSVGIVAAVAVPKLFGQVAKSKASELPLNFSAFKTLQEAYAAEQGRLGAFEVLGFDLPQSLNFVYAPSDNGISAISTVALGDCGVGSTWTMTPRMGGQGIVEWTLVVENSTGADEDCMEKLMPGISYLGEAKSGKAVKAAPTNSVTVH